MPFIILIVSYVQFNDICAQMNRPTPIAYDGSGEISLSDSMNEVQQ